MVFLENNVVLTDEMHNNDLMIQFKHPLIFSLIILFLLFFMDGNAQYYSSGQDPASQRWNQINSENFQVIYPIGYDSMAQYVMNVMEYGRELTIKTKEIEPKKISIILHNQTVISNAEVAWAPKRIEFYTVTPQSVYSQEWFQQLALHEYMHVIQITSMNKGLTKFLNYFFGEQITVGIFGLYVPYWFVEGEAVVSETALSKSGRGRDPNFEAQLRAQLLEEGKYSIEKASLGSFKDFVPDRYHLGYYLVGQAKAVYGKQMWNKPMENIGRYPLGVIPFSTGIKTETGLNKKGLYEKTLLDLSEEWLKQLLATNPKNYDVISQNINYCNYSNHTFVDDSHIFSLKKDFHKNGEFILIDTAGNEELIYKPGYYSSEAITTGGDWLCWSEMQYDARWNYRTYNKILLLNLKTKEKKTLLKKTRYFSPSLSPSGNKIAVVEVDEFSQHSLVILNRENGEVLQRIQSIDNDFIAHPAWSPKEDIIVAEVINTGGKGLALFKLETGRIQQILKYGDVHIQYPSFWENYILFEAAYSGVMDVFALDLATKSLYQTTETAFSASDYAISPNGKKQVMATYTAQGKQLVMQDWNPKNWISISNVNNRAYPLADILSSQEKDHFITDSIPQEKYEVKKYSKFAHLLNIHSWNFIHLDANNARINPGLSILSQNKLSTLTARLGADYSFNTEAMRYYGQMTYLGWYPVMSIGGDYGRRYAYEYREQDTLKHYYNETNINASIYLPLNYTSGLWSFGFRPELGYNFKNLDSGPELTFTYNHIQSVNYSIQVSGQQKTPFQSIFPKWGYALSLMYRQSPFNESLGEIMSLNMAVYYPGIFRHDGFRIKADYQDKIGDAAFYNDVTAPARGYVGIDYDDMLTLRIDYKVPLLYPDWNLGSLLYFKRVVMGVFYDYSLIPDAAVNVSYPNDHFWSTGVDLTTDVHLLRTKFPFEVGLRSTYVNGYIKNLEAFQFQLLFGVSI